MIAQLTLSLLLLVIILYAWVECRKAPLVGLISTAGGVTGLYFVWIPAHATALAELTGVGRGVDLIIYLWVAISLLLILNIHLKLRAQMELITILARTVALNEAYGKIDRGVAQQAFSLNKPNLPPELTHSKSR
jgi:hypothetical protein